MWYAIYTRSCWERRVATVLSGHALETYLPTQKVWDRRSGTRRQVEKPVFPSYLFVRCVLSKEVWLNIKRTMGVVRILGIDNDPVPVPDEEIDALRQILAVQPVISGHPRLRRGDRVRVVQGPLRGVMGTLVEVARNRHRLVVSIHLINRSISTNIDASMVELCDP